MIHTITMIFMLKNMGVLEIKTAREDVVALEVECMVVWVDHPPWHGVDDLGQVVETWALGLVVGLEEEWGKKTSNFKLLIGCVVPNITVQLINKGAHCVYCCQAGLYLEGGGRISGPVFTVHIKYAVWR
jgi:hypothetical protein